MEFDLVLAARIIAAAAFGGGLFALIAIQMGGPDL